MPICSDQFRTLTTCPNVTGYSRKIRDQYVCVNISDFVQTRTYSNPSTSYETGISVDCEPTPRETDWERDDRNGKNSGDVRERIEKRGEWCWENKQTERERVGSLFVPTSLTEARASRLKEIGRSAAKKSRKKKKIKKKMEEGQALRGEKKTTKSWRSSRVSA